MPIKYKITSLVLVLIVAVLATFGAYSVFTDINITPTSQSTTTVNSANIQDRVGDMGDVSNLSVVQQKAEVKIEPKATEPAAYPTITDVFGGRLVKRISNDPVRGEAARQYEFKIDSGFIADDELKGSASGTVIVSIRGEYSGEMNPNLMKIWAYYNPNSGWYEVIRAVVVFVDYEYAADFSDDRVLVGAAHNIFIGKVLRQIEADARTLKSMFEIQVIDNIKGSLSGGVIVNQSGIRVGDVAYVPAGNERSDYILEPGSTYLFVTRYNDADGWHKLNPYPTASVKLSNNASISPAELRALATGNSRVNQLREAYPNEILLEADIRNNNARNSYRSLESAKSPSQ